MLIIEKLSEDRLKQVLEYLYPGSNIAAQKRVKLDSQTAVIDYAVTVEGRTIFFEFDGPTHYTQHKTQLRDCKLTEYCRNITLVRLPYFVQISDTNIDYLFPNRDKSCEVFTEYFSGFIDTKAMLPLDYNIPGVKLCLSQLESYDTQTRSEILSTYNHQTLLDYLVQL